MSTAAKITLGGLCLALAGAGMTVIGLALPPEESEPELRSLEMCAAHEQQYGRPEPSCPACSGEVGDGE